LDKDLRHLIYLLFCMDISASSYIRVFREKNGSVSRANRYFLKKPFPEQPRLDGRAAGMKKKEDHYKRIITGIEKKAFRAIHIGGRGYPAGLENIYAPPPVLFCRGSLAIDGFNIAVVGSRRCTRYGKDAASYISKSLSDMGITVVSGLALGIDSMAHMNSVGGRGGTIAVLGSGPDVIYPPENRDLCRQIIGSGAVVTEFPPGTPPLRQNFPIRNRIISGISRGVVIVEAGSRSGAMITGETALEQDREVFAVPGSIFSCSSRGCHKLINGGAKLVESADDIIEEFQGLFTVSGSGAEAGQAGGRRKAGIGGKAGKVYDNIGHRPESLDRISLKSGLAVNEVLKAVTMLEMEEMVREGPSNHYRRSE